VRRGHRPTPPEKAEGNKTLHRGNRERAGASGFTLIELIIVIAILAFVSVVGIRSYGNLRDIQARKMNVANIKRIQHALVTYEAIHKEQGSSGFFKNFDSLIDVSANGPWYGAEGTIDWGTLVTEGSSTYLDAREVHGGLGIYDGSWKVLGALYNASGQGSGSVASLADAQAENLGMRSTGLFKSLGIYYLSAADATLLKDAGVTQVLLHNPSSQQASGQRRNGFAKAAISDDGWTQEGLKTPGGGGPGFRPDMSAFYPVALTNGLPVAILNPSSAAYADFGYMKDVTNATSSAHLTTLVSGQTTKLLAFGIGINAECVKSSLGLGDAPYDPVYDKKNYRQYIAVFAITTGGQGTPSTCRLAGVVDPAGNTVRAAEYQVNWTSKLE
jgi:prepilin-type N-terminal cleavage/methylation domain-containing protein